MAEFRGRSQLVGTQSGTGGRGSGPVFPVKTTRGIQVEARLTANLCRPAGGKEALSLEVEVPSWEVIYLRA